MGTHTPGPWEFNGEAVLDKRGRNVCTKDNGYLIASAPELLEACKQAASLLESQNDNGMGKRTDVESAEVYLKLESAIAKAEGRA